MSQIIRLLLVSITMSMFVGVSYAGVKLKFPEIPSPDHIPSASDMIKDAKVEETETETDGYKVTDSEGNTFYVDDIDDPVNVFYGLYVDVDTDSALSPDIEINSDIDIGVICFDNC